VIIFWLVVLAAIAGVAGYFVGVRRAPAKDFPTQTSAPQVAPAGVESSDRGIAPLETVGAERIGAEKARLIRSLDSESAALRRQLVDRGADLAVGEEFARDRAQMFRDLAAARAEIARYRQVVIDIENNAPPPILAGAGEPDDLKLIVGVGPVLERMLHSLGITTFRQIARWSDRDVAEFDAKLPEFPGRIVRDQWVTQSRALHQSKYGEQP
jgi:predicted flap endonuclease-1-like 5' DNA nuclease